MRLLLHIGMTKTGSTALQTSLAAARRELRKRGVLYPKGALNQNFLIAGLAAPAQIGRLFIQHYHGDAEAVRADFEEFWTGIVAAARKHQPSTLVLSAESIFGALLQADPEPLRALLAGLGATIEVVCYVRRPSDYYLSVAQQKLKASHVIRAVAPIAYRRPLEAAATFADVMHVVRYDRSLFPGGDISLDFAARFLADAAETISPSDHRKVKPSMSAEAMALVQAYRRDRHRDENDRFTPDTGALMRRLAGREVELGGQRRPQLIEDVRRFIDQSSVDLVWLRDTCGIAFEGIDYGSIEARQGWQPESVNEICTVDPDRMTALATVLNENDPQKAKPARSPKFRTVHARRGAGG